VRGLWRSAPKRPVPKHPYRDTAVLYGVLAAIVVVFAAATGGDVVKAVIVAVIVYVGATAYSWWYWYDRIKNKERGDIDRRARK
jgi:membrane protein implicated in regulation of membrane protease activity